MRNNSKVVGYEVNIQKELFSIYQQTTSSIWNKKNNPITLTPPKWNPLGTNLTKYLQSSIWRKLQNSDKQNQRTK